MSKQLKAWEEATIALTEEFINKYFPGEECDCYWVADEVGGVLSINDYFFDLKRIVEAIKYKATKEQLFDYYDMELKKHPERMEINFKNYVKYGEIKNE